MMMTIVYLNGTHHILAATSAGGDTAALIGQDGLHLTSLRGVFPSPMPANRDYGPAPSGEERFVIPSPELSVKQLPFDPAVIVQPYTFLADVSTAVRLPPSTGERPLRIQLTSNYLRLATPVTGLVIPQIKFPVDHAVYIQIEGLASWDRRVVRGVIQKNDDTPFDFYLTAEPGGPLAPIAPGRRYYVLVMIEGLPPDERTIDL